MKYDVFISYRREGGYDTAKHLNDLLVRDGYRVSFDIDTLRSGDFDVQLYQRIDECQDFILIVDKNAFERTLDPYSNPKNDWLRCELAYALKRNKNIIPVFLAGVNSFPDYLPSDIADVTTKNGPEYNRYHFNSFYEILKTRFLHKKTNHKKGLFIALSLLGILLAILCYRYISNKSEISGKSLSSASSNNKNSSGTTREDVFQLFTGSYSIAAPGYMKDGITWVYYLELSPTRAANKGTCGTEIQEPEEWTICSFSLHNSLKYAIADLRRVDDWYDGETQYCKVKLELDEYNNITMSFIQGNSAPAPLYDTRGGYSKTAVFLRE